MDNITSYLGYTAGIKEPLKTRVETILDKKYRYEGKLYNARTLMLTLLLDGSVPKMEENVIRYNARTGERNKPKTEYSLYSNRNEFLQINKTEYDFCLYCVENGYTNIENVNNYIENESRQLALFKEEEERKQRLLKEKEEKEKEEKERTMKEIHSQLSTVSEAEKQLADAIFMDKYGRKATQNNYIFILLIRNIDNPVCRKRLMDWLLSNENTASIKLFECITGVKLPKGQKRRLEFLKTFSSADIVGIKEYKPRKKPDRN